MKTKPTKLKYKNELQQLQDVAIITTQNITIKNAKNRTNNDNRNQY